MSEKSRFKILLTRAQEGDREAADELIRSYSNEVMQIIRAQLGRKLRGKLESMDIYQTAMKSAYRNLDKFRGNTPGAFMEWLSKILINDIKDKAGYFIKVNVTFR